jgi:ATP-dependent Clp protease protease subunit
MKKSWYAIKAAATEDAPAEIHILDSIGAWNVNAKQFIADLRAIAANKVKLFINSPGGSVFEALGIFNGLRTSGKSIEVHVLGIAASAASYIAMAGDRIVMPANTMMFVHNPINGVYGNAEDMREMAGILDKIGSSLTATYAKRFKGSDEELEALLADESYLTAAECLKYGFCDEVVDEINATASFDLDLIPEAVRSVFMSAKAEQPPVVEPPQPQTPLAEQVNALAVAAGVQEFAAYFVVSAASLAQAQEAVAQAKEIKALALHAGVPEMTAALVRGGTSLADARAAIANQLATADENASVNTARPAASLEGAGKPGADWTPSSQWRDIHDMKAGSKQ